MHYLGCYYSVGNAITRKLKEWKTNWKSILSDESRTKPVVTEADQKTWHNLEPLIPTSIVQKIF